MDTRLKADESYWGLEFRPCQLPRGKRERKHGFGFLVEQECFGMPKGQCLRVSGQSGGNDIVSLSLAVTCPFGG